MTVPAAAIEAAQRVERIGDATLLLGDCLAILPTIGVVDAIVTDPPYGIGVDGNWYANPDRWKVPVAKEYGTVSWDAAPITLEAVHSLLRHSRHQVIFGGNYFDGLGPTQCWLVWDKEASGNFAECELAWTNLSKPVKRIRWLWNGFKKHTPEERFHPTQKPAGVMRWCIEHLPQDCSSILDPFMGSGTTGVACAKLGRKFVGIEIDEGYFDIACRRIEAAYRQPDMFIDRPAPAVQEPLFKTEAET